MFLTQISYMLCGCSFLRVGLKKQRYNYILCFLILILEEVFTSSYHLSFTCHCLQWISPAQPQCKAFQGWPLAHQWRVHRSQPHWASGPEPWQPVTHHEFKPSGLYMQTFHNALVTHCFTVLYGTILDYIILHYTILWEPITHHQFKPFRFIYADFLQCFGYSLFYSTLLCYAMLYWTIQ